MNAGIANYWKEMKACSKKTPIYYAPTLSGSFFPEDLKGFNSNNIDKKYSVIHKIEKTKLLDGIQTPMTFIGEKIQPSVCTPKIWILRRSATITLARIFESWYVVERRFKDKIVELAKNSIYNNACDHLLVQRATMITPKAMDGANIVYSVVYQNCLFEFLFLACSTTWRFCDRVSKCISRRLQLGFKPFRVCKFCWYKMEIIM